MKPSEYMTLSDITKATNGGKAPISLIVDEFSKPLTLLKDLPVRQATDKFEDNGSFIEPWEYNKHSETTDLDSGTALHKLDTYSRKDFIGYRDTGIGIREREYIAAGADFTIDSIFDWKVSEKIGTFTIPTSSQFRFTCSICLDKYSRYIFPYFEFK